MSKKNLAINGTAPVRKTILNYGSQTITEEDKQNVLDVLESDWLTTGPEVEAFESAFADFVEAEHAVAVSSGTAALHSAIHTLNLEPGDEVILPPMTFAATANTVVFEDGTPVFADIEPDTLLLSPDKVEDKITERTKAIVAVDYAGQPCQYDRLREIADANDITLIADACHAIGATYRGEPVGSLANLSTFSFHPVKNMTTGEGGMITTDDPEKASQMRQFRNHGITETHHERKASSSWEYDIPEPGFNYRLTDMQCALGQSQLENLPKWNERRRQIASRYDEAFRDTEPIKPINVRDEVTSARHLYVVKINLELLSVGRERIFEALREEGIGVNVHYIPTHQLNFYRENFDTGNGQCPNTESAYERILTLPVFPAMSDDDTEDVIQALRKIMHAYGRGDGDNH
jgi:perosamine synthetase